MNIREFQKEIIKEGIILDIIPIQSENQVEFIVSSYENENLNEKFEEFFRVENLYLIDKIIRENNEITFIIR